VQQANAVPLVRVASTTYHFPNTGGVDGTVRLSMDGTYREYRGVPYTELLKVLHILNRAHDAAMEEHRG
jgi:hypothetical protein